MARARDESKTLAEVFAAEDDLLERVVAKVMTAYDSTHRGLTRAWRQRREKYEDRLREVLAADLRGK